MAAQPLKRRLVEELEKRAAALSQERGEELTALDVVHDWVAAGRTMRDLSRELGKAIGRNLESSGVLTTWVHGQPGGRALMAQAREMAAHALAEETIEILEEADEEKSALLKARLRAENNRWLASKYNRRDYGETPPQLAVNLDFGSLHIDAMRQRRVEDGDTTPTLALPVPEAEYELVSDDKALEVQEANAEAARGDGH